MAQGSGIYTNLKTNLMNKAVNLGSDTIKVALMGSGYAWLASNSTWSNVSANEIAAGNGYTAGGATLTGLSVAANGTTPTYIQWTASNAAWTASSFTAYAAIIYDTSNSNSLICCIDFGGAKTVSSGTFTLSWDAANGIIQLQ